MKKIRLFLAALMCLLMVPALSYADGRPIPVDQLPAEAKAFVQNHFPNLKIIYAEKDGAVFETRLSNGTEVEFDKKGAWTKVDCNFDAVPDAIVPTSIATQVKATFPDAKINKIEIDRRGYEIELSNDIDMTFSKEGQLIKMDD
jgi:hypothetical protein